MYAFQMNFQKSRIFLQSFCLGLLALSMSGVLGVLGVLGLSALAHAQENRRTAASVVSTSTEQATFRATTFSPIFPFANTVEVSSGFGWRQHPLTGRWGEHPGLDLPASVGTPIYATESGSVIQAAWVKGFGNFVHIAHAQGYTSKYGHVSEILVQLGQYVQQGQVIARVGSTGSSTGPHLHFEITYFEKSLNPLALLYAPGVFTGHLAGTFAQAARETKTLHFPAAAKTSQPYYLAGDAVVAVRVRSGKVVKW